MHGQKNIKFMKFLSFSLHQYTHFSVQSSLQVKNIKKLTISGIIVSCSGVPKRGVWGVQTPPEIPKIPVETSITQPRRTGVSIFFCSSLCSHTVVIY